MTLEVDTTDVGTLMEEVKRSHGPQAFEYAANTAKQHLLSAAWKSGALWLKVVNRLRTAESSSLKHPEATSLSH